MADIEFRETFSDRLQTEGCYCVLIRPMGIRTLGFFTLFGLVWVLAVVTDSVSEWVPLVLIPPMALLCGVFTILGESWGGRTIGIDKKGRVSLDTGRRDMTNGRVIESDVIHDRNGKEMIVLLLEFHANPDYSRPFVDAG